MIMELTKGLYVSNPGSFEDVVELLVPELQRRGIYWSDYAAPGGTARENISSKPGEPLLAKAHPGAKVRWNAPQPGVPGAATTAEDVKIEQIKGADVPVATVATTEVSV